MPLVADALKKGQTAPKYHALTRPTRAEGEATGRAVALAEMAGVPIYIVHLSCSDDAMNDELDCGLPQGDGKSDDSGAVRRAIKAAAASAPPIDDLTPPTSAALSRMPSRPRLLRSLPTI